MRKELMDTIIQEEWNQFQKVQNEGGRASCQDNWQEFYIMRKSQFSLWPEELLESYQKDLEQAREKGENLIFQKYAFMMKDTDPEGYERIAGRLPVISNERRKRIAESVTISLTWAREFQNQYPFFGRNGRPINKRDALPGETSIETYLTGELCSYGEKTEKIYAAHVRQNKAAGNNLIYHERLFMAKMYGYDSIEEVEQFLKQKYHKA